MDKYEVSVTYSVEARSVKEAVEKLKIDVDTQDVLSLNVEIIPAED